MAPPGSIPNPEVKHTSADGSVGSPHVRVGHRQTSNKQSLVRKHGGFFYACSPDARRPHTAYVAHLARQSTSARAQNAHATTAPRTSRILRDNPYRAVRPGRTLQINRTLSPKMAAFISIYPYYYSDVMQQHISEIARKYERSRGKRL